MEDLSGKLFLSVKWLTCFETYNFVYIYRAILWLKFPNITV